MVDAEEKSCVNSGQNFVTGKSRGRGLYESCRFSSTKRRRSENYESICHRDASVSDREPISRDSIGILNRYYQGSVISWVILTRVSNNVENSFIYDSQFPKLALDIFKRGQLPRVNFLRVCSGVGRSFAQKHGIKCGIKFLYKWLRFQGNQFWIFIGARAIRYSREKGRSVVEGIANRIGRVYCRGQKLIDTVF